MLALGEYKELLVYACCLLPPVVTVVLLGHRGFRTRDLMDWCRTEAGWHFCLRLKGD
ncbi:MAG: hypothetical protein M5U01_36040 [Ardenticatenaceae bacterium]|nr:hypothetical protein [Ardenticatenaceae bacterium]